MRFVGFGVVIMVEYNLAEAQIGDIAIQITNISFVSRMKVWVQMQDGPSGWHIVAQFQQQFHFTTYLAQKFQHYICKAQKSTLEARNI